MGAVGAPVVGEEADFGLARREDVLQAALLGGVAHVVQHPVEQLADESRDIFTARRVAGEHYIHGTTTATFRDLPFPLDFYVTC